MVILANRTNHLILWYYTILSFNKQAIYSDNSTYILPAVGSPEHVPLYEIRSEEREENGGIVQGKVGNTYFHNFRHGT